ncbi:MAG: protein YgfX [Burkholderiales bacterium]
MTPVVFSGMIRLPLRSSRTLSWLLVASHLAAAASLLLLPWPRLLSWPILLLVGVLLVRGLRREAWRCSAHSVVRLDLAGGRRLCVFRKDGRRQLGTVLPDSFVAPDLVLLRWRPERGGRSRCCMIAADAAEPSAHRMLRVLLRHPL